MDSCNDIAGWPSWWTPIRAIDASVERRMLTEFASGGASDAHRGRLWRIDQSNQRCFTFQRSKRRVGGDRIPWRQMDHARQVSQPVSSSRSIGPAPASNCHRSRAAFVWHTDSRRERPSAGLARSGKPERSVRGQAKSRGGAGPPRPARVIFPPMPRFASKWSLSSVNRRRARSRLDAMPEPAPDAVPLSLADHLDRFAIYKMRLLPLEIGQTKPQVSSRRGRAFSQPASLPPRPRRASLRRRVSAGRIAARRRQGDRSAGPRRRGRRGPARRGHRANVVADRAPHGLAREPRKIAPRHA